MSRIISATLTRNNGVYSTSQVRMGALTPCHESTLIVDSTDNDSIGQGFSSSDTQQVLYRIFQEGVRHGTL